MYDVDRGKNGHRHYAREAESRFAAYFAYFADIIYFVCSISSIRLAKFIRGAN
jgi:hypothetical protein